jgi:hypothetical protein
MPVDEAVHHGPILEHEPRAERREREEEHERGQGAEPMLDPLQQRRPVLGDGHLPDEWAGDRAEYPGEDHRRAGTGQVSRLIAPLPTK